MTSIWSANTATVIPGVNADNSYKVESFTATQGQVLFTLTSYAYVVGTASLSVYVNGVYQTIVTDYIETSPVSITLNLGTYAGDFVTLQGLIGTTGEFNAVVAATNAAASAASALTAVATLQAYLINSTGAPSIGYLPPGTGALQTTVAAMLDSFTLASNFGVTTASADVTVALQKAIDYVTSVGGKVLTLPEGIIKLGSGVQVTITKGIILRGSGAGFVTGTTNTGGTVLQNTTVSGDGLIINSTSAVVLENFTLDASTVIKTVGTAGIRIQGNTGTGSLNSATRITNIKILGMSTSIYCDSTASSTIENCYIQDFGVNGIYFKQTGSPNFGQSTVHSCVICDLTVGTSSACIRYDKGGDVRIALNKLLGGAYALYVSLDDNTETVIFEGNVVQQQRTNSVLITQSVTQKVLGNIQIVNNQFSQLGYVAQQSSISITNGTGPGGVVTWLKNIILANNIFNTNVSGAYPIINVQCGDGVIINGNVLNNNSVAGPVGITAGLNILTGKVSGNLIINTPSGLYSDSTVLLMEPTGILIFSTGTAFVPASATVYVGVGSYDVTDQIVTLVLPYKCKLLNMTVKSDVLSSGVFNYQLRVNGVNTALQCVIAAGQTTARDITHVVSVPAFSPVSVRLLTGPADTATHHFITISVVADS